MSHWGMWPAALWLIVVGVAFVRYLRVLYAGGTLDHREVQRARQAMLLPALLMVVLLGAIVLAIDLLPGLAHWLPLVLGVATLGGSLWALERAIRAVRCGRAESGATR